MYIYSETVFFGGEQFHLLFGGNWKIWPSSHLHILEKVILALVTKVIPGASLDFTGGEAGYLEGSDGARCKDFCWNR